MLEKTFAASTGIPARRVYNFGAGPAMLPIEVMQQAREEFTDWHGKGISVMEMSHRSDEFISIAEQAEIDLRELLLIPDNFKVLFLQGGATSQFAMIPLNLLHDNNTADYLHTGQIIIRLIICIPDSGPARHLRKRTGFAR